MKFVLLVLIAATNLYATDDIEVKSKFVESRVCKIQPTKEEAVEVSFTFEGKRTPNFVGFVIYSAIPGWTCTGAFGQKDWKKNGSTCMWPSETYGEDHTMMSWECVRPTQPKLDLIFEATEPKIKSPEKEKYSHFKPVSASECKNMAKHRVFLRVIAARAWTEREMAEEEFLFSEKCRTYIEGCENMIRVADSNSRKGLTISLWADITPEKEAEARKVINEEAKRLGVKIEEIKKGKRKYHGGMAEDPLPEMTRPRYGAVIIEK